jgi:hypothetical protein
MGARIAARSRIGLFITVCKCSWVMVGAARLETRAETTAAARKSAGASWNDVIDITTFHTDLTTQMPAIVAVKTLV